MIFTYWEIPIVGFHLLGILNVLTGKNRNDAAQAIRLLSEDVFPSSKIIERQLSSKGGHKTKLVSFEDALQFIMVFPGKVAKETRCLFCDIIRRYLGGDKSLISEIECNAVSNSPIAQFAKASMISTAAPVQVNQKRQLDRDETLFELDVAERKQKLAILASEAQNKSAEAQMKAADAQMKVMGVQKMLMESYALLCPNHVMDDRARLLFKDNFLNIATQSVSARGPQLAIASDPQLAISDGAAAVNNNKPITISTLAAELGYRFDNGQLQKIGKKVANAYREKYGECPGKHEQMVGQASILVNSYTERDRGLVEKVIVDFINE